MDYDDDDDDNGDEFLFSQKWLLLKGMKIGKRMNSQQYVNKTKNKKQ